jgi:hypothetical protein
MRHRLAGEGNLYDADKEMQYNEKQLAVFAYILDFDPTDVDSMDIEDAVDALRKMWIYSSDIRGSVEPTYTNNALPRFLTKMNVTLKDRIRRASWNYSLSKAAKNG